MEGRDVFLFTQLGKAITDLRGMRGDDKEINLNCPKMRKFPKMEVK